MIDVRMCLCTFVEINEFWLSFHVGFFFQQVVLVV